MNAAGATNGRGDRDPTAGSGNRRVNLVGLGRDELSALLSRAGVPDRQIELRGRQVRNWIFRGGARSVGEVRGLGRNLNTELARHCTIRRPTIARRLVSSDGTRKYLLRVAGGHEIETVYIPDGDRGTLCISSQIGCTLNCGFCHTGTQPLVRNLAADEIIGQVLVARDDIGDWERLARGERRLTNIVLMGMGEPLLNIDAVTRAMNVVMDNEGISLSRRRITLSTSGIVPEIGRAGRDIGCMLAVSLHATTDEVRNRLVPINRKYGIESLLRACRAYPRLSNAERIVFEYVMLKDVNDSPEDAHRLVGLIRGIPAKINLIPFNPWPGSPFTCSGPETVKRFAGIINRAGYSCPVRTPRGSDIMAACGQLKSISTRLPGKRSPRCLGQAG